MPVPPLARMAGAMDRLIAPSTAIPDEEVRVRARLHSALLLVLLVGGTLAIGYEVARDRDQLGSAASVVALASLGLLLVLYAISRTRYSQLASAATVLVVSTVIWRLWAIEFPETGSMTGLYFVALPLVLNGMLMPFWFTAAFTAATVLTAAAIPIFLRAMGQPPFADDVVVNLVIFVVLVAGLVLVAARVLDLARAEVHEQRRQVSQQAEELHAVNRRLQSVEENRKRLLHQVAHDMASPLTPIRLQLAILRQDSAINARPLDIVERNVLQLQNLVEDIKDLGRIEDGQLKLEMRKASLADLVATSCDAFRPKATAVGVVLSCEAEPGLEAIMDPQRIQQVVDNLLSNALKFTPEGGLLRVQARRAADHAEVLVSDSGRGLLEEEMRRLFVPFSQVHDPAEARERGTGLGLYICKGFVDRHGGRIGVESDGRGKGSRFMFSIPVATGPTP